VKRQYQSLKRLASARPHAALRMMRCWRFAKEKKKGRDRVHQEEAVAVTFGMAGVGTALHIAGLELEYLTGIKMTVVPLEQQMATSEFLGMISSSPTDTQPVFDAIVESALKLFPGATIIIAPYSLSPAALAAAAHVTIPRAIN
jgi:hypothetical protein